MDIEVLEEKANKLNKVNGEQYGHTPKRDSSDVLRRSIAIEVVKKSEVDQR